MRRLHHPKILINLEYLRSTNYVIMCSGLALTQLTNSSTILDNEPKYTYRWDFTYYDGKLTTRALLIRVVNLHTRRPSLCLVGELYPEDSEPMDARIATYISDKRGQHTLCNSCSNQLACLGS